MTGITRPTGEQLLFRSSTTGNHVLDDYLEAAEKGGRTLGQMLGDLFDSGTGTIKAGLVEFRLNQSTRELESRAGGYVNPEEGWVGSGAFFSRYRGDYASGTTYRATDYVRITGTVYLVTADHTGGASPNMANFTSLIASDSLAAISAAGAAEADRLPYFTGATTAAFAVFTAYARQLAACATATDARTALGLGALANASTASMPSFTMATNNRVTQSAAPTTGSHLANKTYVDAQVATKADPLGYTPVNRAGDTLTGFLSLHANPTQNLHATPKQYVDTRAPVPSAVPGRVLRVQPDGSTTAWGKSPLIPSIQTGNFTAEHGYHYILTGAGAQTVTMAAGMVAEDNCRITVANGRTDNAVAFNGHKHEGLSDATMTISDKHASFSLYLVSAGFGFKVGA